MVSAAWLRTLWDLILATVVATIAVQYRDTSPQDLLIGLAMAVALIRTALIRTTLIRAMRIATSRGPIGVEWASNSSRRSSAVPATPGSGWICGWTGSPTDCPWPTS